MSYKYLVTSKIFWITNACHNSHAISMRILIRQQYFPTSGKLLCLINISENSCFWVNSLRRCIFIYMASEHVYRRGDNPLCIIFLLLLSSYYYCFTWAKADLHWLKFPFGGLYHHLSILPRYISSWLGEYNMYAKYPFLFNFRTEKLPHI